jgi:hypothetical protein
MKLPGSLRFFATVLFGAALTVSAVRGAPSDAPSDIFLALTKAADAHVSASLEGRAGGGFGGGRGTGAQFMVYAAVYANSASQYYHDAKLIPAMAEFTKVLKESQFPDGLWGDAGNIDSPPDSSFVLKTIAKGQRFLVTDGSPATEALRAQMKAVILACAEGVRTGGVHTPNHRWMICSALANVNAVYPDKNYVTRIDEWLAEGLDVDEDGQWAERSPNYTSDVNDPAVLDVAILLQRPKLLEAIRRNLEMTVYHVEVNGEVETVASRRQDQRAGSRKHIWEYYYPYRYLAVHDNNGTFAAVAARIEHDFLKDIGDAVTNMSSALTCMMLYPEMAKPLPAAKPLEENYAKVFPKTAMARVRRGNVTATIYGGSDWRSGLGVGSGLAMNPTFFKMRKGEAILESVRMTPAFFSTGFFYSDGLKQKDGGYVLSQELKVPYHLPLPANKRRANGQYDLSPDMGNQGILGRYFSKLSFADRDSQYRTLKTEVSVKEKDGAFEVTFEVTNVAGLPNVGVTIELGFRPGGKFTGVEPAATGGRGPRGGGGGEAGAPSSRAARAARGGELLSEDAAGSYVLKQGMGTYTVGSDTIEFGPGNYARPPGRMESEAYTWIEGNLRAEGDRVYLTGVTPFKYTMTLR